MDDKGFLVGANTNGDQFVGRSKAKPVSIDGRMVIKHLREAWSFNWTSKSGAIDSFGRT